MDDAEIGTLLAGLLRHAQDAFQLSISTRPVDRTRLFQLLGEIKIIVKMIRENV
jgi:hypothetical protein